MSYKKGCAGAYRYGFNGQEKVDEIKGVGNHNTALFWEYDTRLGRRWNVDPVDQVGISNYVVMRNNPIFWTDYLGNVVANSSGQVLFTYDQKTGVIKQTEYATVKEVALMKAVTSKDVGRNEFIYMIKMPEQVRISYDNSSGPKYAIENRDGVENYTDQVENSANGAILGGFTRVLLTADKKLDYVEIIIFGGSIEYVIENKYTKTLVGKVKQNEITESITLKVNYRTMSYDNILGSIFIHEIIHATDANSNSSYKHDKDTYTGNVEDYPTYKEIKFLNAPNRSKDGSSVLDMKDNSKKAEKATKKENGNKNHKSNNSGKKSLKDVGCPRF